MFSFSAKTMCAHNREASMCGNGKSNQKYICKLFCCCQKVMQRMTTLRSVNFGFV